MRLIAKLALAALAGGVLLRRGGGVPILTYYAQGDPEWARTLLGFSPTKTIWQEGCMMSALGMSAGAMLGAEHDFSPGVMNDLLRAAGAFSGDLMILSPAADAVDLFAPDRAEGAQWAPPSSDYDDRIHAGHGASKEVLRNIITRALSQKRCCLVNVDKTFTGTGEHWCSIHDQSGGYFLGADPATGKDTPISISTLSNPGVDWGSQGLITYDVVGVAPLYRKAA